MYKRSTYTYLVSSKVIGYILYRNLEKRVTIAKITGLIKITPLAIYVLN